MPGVRITAGDLKGRRIAVPATSVRPTSDRARQAFFNIISDQIQDASFLDLFAGTGIFAFEALSRGASEAVAVDISRGAVRTIEEKAREWSLALRAVVLDLSRGAEMLVKLGEFDVVYADPPYDWDGREALLKSIDERLLLRPGAVVAIEHRRGALHIEQLGLARLLFRKTAEYGTIAISYFDHVSGENE